MFYKITKTFGHDRGYSCVFRQKDAESHCRFLHGYSLSFKFEIGAKTLDDRNWVYDFGDFKQIKKNLETWFDHTLVIADNDKELLDTLGSCSSVANIHIFYGGVGCELFAKFVYLQSKQIIEKRKGVQLLGVTVSEHSGNSAFYGMEQNEIDKGFL